MRTKYLLAIMLVPIIMSLPAAASVDNQTYHYDGAPMTILLVNALNALYSRDFNSVIEYSDYALSTNTPQELTYLHEKSWRLLKEFSNLSIEIIESNSTSERDIYEIYRLKIEISETIPQYARKILGYVNDPPTNYKLSRILGLYLSKLDPTMDSIIESLIKKGVKTHVHAYLLSPNQVYAGSNMSIKVLIEPTINVSKIRVIILTTLPIYNKTYTIYKPVNEYNITCNIPGTQYRSYSGEETLAKLFAVINGEYQNTPINLIVSKQLTITTVRPKLYFQMPHIIMPGHNLTMTIISKNDELLTLNVTIKPARNNTILFYKTLEIPPGESIFTFRTGKLEPGFYTLFIKVLPKGKYQPAQYSKAIAIQEPQLKAYAPKIILGPPFTALIKLEVNHKLEDGLIIVKQGEHVYYNQSIANIHANMIQLRLGWTLIASTKHVIVKYVSPNSKTYAYAELNIMAVNFISIVVLVIIFTSISAVSARGLAVNIDRVTRIITRASKVSKGSITTTFTAIYRKFIGLLASKALPPPKPSETLREFYDRIYHSLKNQGDNRSMQLIWSFIVLYEKYLYSLRKPRLSDFKKLFNEIAGIFR